MDPVSMLSGYGVFAVLGYLLVKDLGGYLLRRVLPPRGPAVPDPAPALPTDPKAPSDHPVLDAVLAKVFGRAAVPAGQTDPSFLAQMKGELDKLVPTPPAK